MEQQKHIQQRPSNEDEIDLVEIARLLWGKRRFILKVTAIFFVIGLTVALLSPVEYEASCKLMPESQEGAKGNLGSLGGLAGLAGINLDGGGGTLSPELYPEIAKSVPFQLKILHTPIYYEANDTSVSSYVYFKEIATPSALSGVAKYTIGLPSVIRSWLFGSKDANTVQKVGSELIQLTKEDTELIERFRQRISVSVDSKTGIISLAAEMPDAFAAAGIADKVVEQLTEEISNYKAGKARINLEFIQERFEESRKEFNERQRLLAAFTDRNKNLNSALAQIEYQRLQNEYNIAFEVYKGLANQLEQAKIKVKEETPVFTVLEPVKVPVEKSKPQRKLIVIAWIAGGVFIGFIVVLFQNWKKHLHI